ncbi:hypothetical protein KAR91_66690 [Candidatus Pacearchaeota archaeon]|nr:hypothetical protein [Candidatus Pacearchaeota archaeon]
MGKRALDSFIGKIVLFGTLCALVLAFSGCAMRTSGPHSGCAPFQKTRGNKAHSMKGRVYNPNDFRYQHEIHNDEVE